MTEETWWIEMQMQSSDDGRHAAGIGFTCARLADFSECTEVKHGNHARLSLPTRFIQKRKSICGVVVWSESELPRLERVNGDFSGIFVEQQEAILLGAFRDLSRLLEYGIGHAIVQPDKWLLCHFYSSMAEKLRRTIRAELAAS